MIYIRRKLSKTELFDEILKVPSYFLRTALIYCIIGKFIADIFIFLQKSVQYEYQKAKPKKKESAPYFSSNWHRHILSTLKLNNL